MSVPSYDLSKVQFSSQANAFKNDSRIYTGTLNFPTSAVSGVNSVSQAVTLDSAPQFSILYGYFQEQQDTLQQFIVGSGYNTAQWYQASVDALVGLVVTAPAPQAGVLSALIYPVINGNTITVTGILNNPYGVTVTLAALSVPFAFVTYTMTN